VVTELVEEVPEMEDIHQLLVQEILQDLVEMVLPLLFLEHQ
jgi:hypothetical protein